MHGAVHGAIQKSDGGGGDRCGSQWEVWNCTWDETDDTWRKKRSPFSFHAINPSRYAPGYLDSTLHDECGEFRHHKVHTFEAGLFEFEDLLFDNRLESQVGGEEPRSEPSQVQGAFCCSGGSIGKAEKTERVGKRERAGTEK